MENVLKLAGYQWFPQLRKKRASLSELNEINKKTQAFINQLQSKGGQVCVYGGSDYPKAFMDLDNPPLALSYWGQPVWKDRKCLAVVGSRNPSQQTLQWLDEFLPEVIKSTEVCLVSGGARGVDQKVHSISIRNNNPTVCFVPSGLFELYPKSLVRFVRPIIEAGGAVVSQFSPVQPMFKSNFYARNRLIAAISKYVFIAEANARSGSYLTARMAIELGRPVGALPFFPCSQSGEGNLNLLFDGADMIKNAESLTSQLNWGV